MTDDAEIVSAAASDAAAPDAGAAGVPDAGAGSPAPVPAPSLAKIPEHDEAYVYDRVCVASIRGVMDIFSGKWSFLVLEQLHVGTMRFGDLRRALGVSTKSLTDTLRHLESKGIIARKAYPTVPVTVEYSLTEKGRSFDSVLFAMKEWGRANL